jgi:hypothetical protein
MLFHRYAVIANQPQLIKSHPFRIATSPSYVSGSIETELCRDNSTKWFITFIQRKDNQIQLAGLPVVRRDVWYDFPFGFSDGAEKW